MRRCSAASVRRRCLPVAHNAQREPLARSEVRTHDDGLRAACSYDIEERWPEIVQRARDSQLRRLEDVTLAGGLHLNHGHATSRAGTRGIRYRYVGIGEQTAAAELRRLIADRDTLQTFCLNDAVQELPSDVVDRQVRAFLAERFPDMGSFEKLPG